MLSVPALYTAAPAAKITAVPSRRRTEKILTHCFPLELIAILLLPVVGAVDPDAYRAVLVVHADELSLMAGEGAQGGQDVQLVLLSGKQSVHHIERQTRIDLPAI